MSPLSRRSTARSDKTLRSNKALIKASRLLSEYLARSDLDGQAPREIKSEEDEEDEEDVEDETSDTEILRNLAIRIEKRIKRSRAPEQITVQSDMSDGAHSFTSTSGEDSDGQARRPVLRHRRGTSPIPISPPPRPRVEKTLRCDMLRVDWNGYMFFADILNSPAMLILHGPAKHYSEYVRERIAKGRLRSAFNSEIDLRADTKPVALLSNTTKKEPVTGVHLSSELLRSIMESISGFDDIFAVFWPFKFFQYFESDIKNTLKDYIAKTSDTQSSTYQEHREKNTSKKENVATDEIVVVEENSELNRIRKPADILTTHDTVVEVEDEPEPNHSPKSNNISAPEKEDVRAVKSLQCIVDFIDEDLKLIRDRLAPAKCHKVRFEELWFIFRIGDVLFAPVSSNLRNKIRGSASEGNSSTDILLAPSTRNRRYQEIWRILHTTGGRPIRCPEDSSTELKVTITKFRARCYYIDFDGTRFVPIIHDFEIEPFEGERDITSLEICPSRFVSNGEEIKAELRKSREVFRDFVKYKSFYYSGMTLVGNPCGCGVHTEDLNSDEMHPEYVESPVIVDFSEAVRNHQSWFPVGKSLDAMDPKDKEVYQPRTLNISSSSSGKVRTTSNNYWTAMSDFQIDRKIMEDFIADNKFLSKLQEGAATNFNDLGADDLVLLPSRVFAFVLRSRKFALLDLRILQPVSRQEHSFDRLKLPDGHKRMVQSLVIHHMNEMNARSTQGAQGKQGETYEYDIVRGKGKGLIVLLHGAPGVGKTSTAECVAEASGKPLFPITCGDLGIVASEVEKNLEKKFHLAQRWNCVLLLDEADVFLTQSTRNDINHNSLVSVFLRVLEYYTGILFLTTNRVGTFDSAFKSRIHISLYYPPLRPKQTMAIWKMNLEQLCLRKEGQLLIDQTAILDFAETHYNRMRQKNLQWNGRQIRNAVQTAVALAEYEKHLESSRRKSNPETANIPPAPCILGKAHFEVVARAAEEFDDHITAIYGVGEADRAFHRMDRADKMTAINLFQNKRHQGGGLQASSISDQRNQYDQDLSYGSGFPPTGQQQQQQQQQRHSPYSGPRPNDGFYGQKQYDYDEGIYAPASDQDFNPPASRTLHHPYADPRKPAGDLLRRTPEPMQQRPAGNPAGGWSQMGDSMEKDDDNYKWGDDE